MVDLEAEFREVSTLVDIVQEFFPDGRVTQSCRDGVIDVEVELGLRSALGTWGPRIDGARIAVALHVAEHNRHHHPGPGIDALDAQVTLRFSRVAATVLAAGHGAVNVLTRVLS